MNCVKFNRGEVNTIVRICVRVWAVSAVVSHMIYAEMEYVLVSIDNSGCLSSAPFVRQITFYFFVKYQIPLLYILSSFQEYRHHRAICKHTMKHPQTQRYSRISHLWCCKYTAWGERRLLKGQSNVVVCSGEIHIWTEMCNKQ